MKLTHHERCLQRARNKRRSGALSHRLERLAKTDRAVRNILGISTHIEKVGTVMEKAQSGKEVTARYILSRYYRYPRKLLNRMTDADCQLFLQALNEQQAEAQ